MDTNETTPPYANDFLPEDQLGLRKKRTRQRIAFLMCYYCNDLDNEQDIARFHMEKLVAGAKKDLKNTRDSSSPGCMNKVKKTLEMDTNHYNFLAQYKILKEIGSIANLKVTPAGYFTKVLIKGEEDCVYAGINVIESIVSDLEREVKVDLLIDRLYHMDLMENEGTNIKKISSGLNVKTKFQKCQLEEDAADINTRKITIKGKKYQCKATAEAIRGLMNKNFDIETHLDIPIWFHAHLIGKQGTHIKNLKEKYDVNVVMPNKTALSTDVKLQGKRDKVDVVKQLIENKIERLSHEVTVHISEMDLSKLNKNDNLINYVRKQYGIIIHVANSTIINLQEVQCKKEKVIVMKGYDKMVQDARTDILNKIRLINVKAINSRKGQTKNKQKNSKKSSKTGLAQPF